MNMKKVGFVALLILIHFTSSNAQSIQWAQRLGNIKSDKIISIKTDGQGYVFISGYFSTTITIGTNGVVLNYVGSVNSKEAFVAKLDSTGFCYWAKAGGQYFDDRVLGMDVDSSGNCVITGTYWEGGGINFPPINISGSSVGSGDQCFIVKFNSTGTPLWGKYVCSNSYGDDQGLDIAFDKVGNIYTVGFMTNTNLICGGSSVTATNPNTTGTHKQCYWLTKMNANGVFQWAKTFGNLPWDPAANKYIERDIAVCVDEKDGIYITGGFDGTRQFGDSTFTSFGGHDVFTMKYDSSGNFKWAKHAGSDKDDWSNGICSDKNGNIYFTGEHRDSLYLDSMLIKNYDGRDVFVFKLNAENGNPIWGKRAGGNLGSERGNDIWADKNCNVYVCGDINEGAKFGDDIDIPATGLGIQSFLARISPEGQWTWVTTGGGIGDEDRGNTLAKGKGNQVYFGGFFRQAATYGNTNLTSAGSSDAYFVRVHDSMLNRGTPFILNAPTKTVLCGGDTAHLKIKDHSSFYIQPSNNIQFNSDSTKLVFSPNSTTTYYMYGAGIGDCKEYDTLSFTLSVGPGPIVLTRPTDTVLCEGESVKLNLPYHTNFEITPNTGTSLNLQETELTFSPNNTTNYVMIGEITGICGTKDTISFEMIVHPNPDALFEITPKVVLIEQPTFNIQNNSIGASNFKWYKMPANQYFSSNTNLTITESEVGIYCYKLVAQSNQGCLDSMTDCAEVIRKELVYIPSAFSPNGDGKNDIFKPVLLNMDFDKVSGYNFMVVDRFGEFVFKSTNPSEGWDGLWKKTEVEVGTYFYYCTFTTPRGELHSFKGDVSLIR